MKINLLKTILSVVASGFYIFSYAQTTFQVNVGAGGIDKFNSVIPAANESFIIVGESSNSVQGKSNALVLKLNAEGKIIWAKTFGTVEDKENLNDIKATPDNALIAVGERYLSNPQGRGEVGVLLQTDLDGNLKWWGEFDHNGNEAEGFSIQITDDGGYVTAGMMKDLVQVSDPFFNLKSETQHLYVLRTDKDGVSQWAGYLSGDYSSKALFINQTKDRGYIVTGHMYKSKDEDFTNICLMKLDEKGNMVWIKVYDNAGKEEETGMAVYQTADNGYIICGTTFDAGQGEGDIFLVKTNSAGDILWKKTYGGSKTDMAKSMLKLSDGGFVISGTTNSFGSGSNDAFLMKVSGDGKMEWFKTYGTAAYELGLGMTSTNSGYAMVGYFVNEGVVDGFCLTTDKNGNDGCYKGYDLKSMDFPLNIVSRQGIAWEISRSNTIVKKNNANGTRAESPSMMTKQFCEMMK